MLIIFDDYPTDRLLYWRNEQSGSLEKAIKNLFNEDPALTEENLIN